jgi:hypothetical protein
MFLNKPFILLHKKSSAKKYKKKLLKKKKKFSSRMPPDKCFTQDGKVMLQSRRYFLKARYEHCIHRMESVKVPILTSFYRKLNLPVVNMVHYRQVVRVIVYLGVHLKFD